jgi:hypothetical protein
MLQLSLFQYWPSGVGLAVLLRGFCLFDFQGAFHLKNREDEKDLLPEAGCIRCPGVGQTD